MTDQVTRVKDRLLNRRYGMFSAQQLREKGIDLLPEEARSLLSALRPDQIIYRCEGPYGATLYIRYLDTEWKVCREDLERQVRTFRYDWQLVNVIQAVTWGARLDHAKRRFVVVDSLTDG